VDADAPIKDEKDLEKLATANESGAEGFFPVGKNRFWHGGVHLPALKPVVAVRDGTLVAYRIDKKLEVVEIGGAKTEVSTGFALLHHETATPLGQKIEFWSLYMHLLPWQPYLEDPTLEPPVFLRAKRPEKVKTSSAGKGLRLAGDEGMASSAGIVPWGAKLILTGEEPADGHWAKTAPGYAKAKWGKLEGWLKVDRGTSVPEANCKRFLSTAGVKVLSGADPAKVEGEIKPGTVFDVGTGRPTGDGWKKLPYRGLGREVTGAIAGFAVLDGVAVAVERQVVAKIDDPGTDKCGVAVHAEGNPLSPVVAILPKGTIVRFKDPLSVRFEAGTTYHEIEDGGFVPVDRSTLEDEPAIAEPDKYGSVVQPKKQQKVSRGDVLGWGGIHLRSVAAGAGARPVGPGNLVHFEIFSDTHDFFKNPNNEHWFSDTTYKLEAGAQLKKSELLAPADNPKIPVDLPQGTELRIAEWFAGSDHAKVWRHLVRGWRRNSELGLLRHRGFAVNGAIDPFYTSRPVTCWCDEAKLTKVTLGVVQGDYLILQETVDVAETFKLVQYEKKGVFGWAREDELGDFYKQAHRAAKAVEIALAAKPASWSAALDEDPGKRIAIGAGTCVRRDGEDKVAQTFHKVKQGAVEGWVAKERIGSVDATKKVIKLGGEARLLKTVPKTIDEAVNGPALATIAKGAEVSDLDVEQSASEAWIQVAFRDGGGSEITAWARASELGPLLKDRFVLTAALAELFHKAPLLPKAPSESLTNILLGTFKKTAIGAQAGEALVWQGKDQPAKERWVRVQLERTGKEGWQRQGAFDDKRGTKKDLANLVSPHFRLKEDLDFVLPDAPAQVALGATAGDVLKVVGEKASGGVTYQCVEWKGNKGWWPKADLGEEKGTNRELKEPLESVLKNVPKDPPQRIPVRALKDDAVKWVSTKGAFSHVEIVVTFDSDRCHGFIPETDLGDVPAGNAIFQQPVVLNVARTDTLTFDPRTTYAFDKDAAALSVKREIQAPPSTSLRRDKAGHLWAPVGSEGWVDSHLDTASRAFAHAKLSAVSAYDWNTWVKLEETNKAGEEFFSEDGFCDVSALVDRLEKDASGKPRAGGSKDSELEMRDALRNPDVRDYLRNAACRHPSEWDSGTDKKLKKWDRLKKAPWNLNDPDYKSQTELIEKLQFWNDAFAGVKPAPASPTVWHLHPLGFLQQLRRMRGVTLDQLQRIVPPAKPDHLKKYIAYLNEAMDRHEISTPLLQAHFLAQIALESAFFSTAEEGGDKADPDTGNQYEWRFDLDNIRDGDGKHFKGRGLLQVTGRFKYSRYGAYVGIDLTAKPELLGSDPRLACDSAAWFWRRGAATGDLNLVAARGADAATVEAVTYGVNGGTNALDQRMKFFANAKRVLID
jgi:predicted chitinase